MKMKKCICIIGKTGSGKSTLASSLSREGYDEIMSYTDRPMRDGEKSNPTHKFLSSEDFNKIDKSKMLAYFYYAGYRYCTTVDQLKEKCCYVVDQESYEKLALRGFELNTLFIPVYVKVSFIRRLFRCGFKRFFRDFIKNPVPNKKLAKGYYKVSGKGNFDNDLIWL